MDFVDLDKVLDEFEEEEKQALSIVPGQELRPSGYLEFLEKHQEQEWALINPSKFSSTSGYTLEHRSARESANVTYDDPYDSFSTYKLGVITNLQQDSLSQNVHDGLSESKNRRNQSAIVTSLTRLSAHDDDVNTVYTATASMFERKGIANRSERKGTIAYQASEVQTDALSPDSEQELMSLPFPKSDILVDGHGDTTMSNESVVPSVPTHCNEMVQNQSPLYITTVDTTDRETDAEPFSSLITNFMNGNQTQETAPRMLEIDTVSNLTSHFSLNLSALTSCQKNTGVFQEGMSTASNLVSQSNQNSSVSNPFEQDTGLPLYEQTVGFHDNRDEDTVDDSEVNMYLNMLNEQKNINVNTLDMQLNTNVVTDESQDTEAYLRLLKEKQNEILTQDLPLAELELDHDFTSQMKSWIKKDDVVSEGLDDGQICGHGSEVVPDPGNDPHSENVLQDSEKFRQNLYNSLITGKMEIENILDDIVKVESDSKNDDEHSCQGKMAIEGILDEAIIKQQSALEQEFHPVQSSEDSDLPTSSHIQHVSHSSYTCESEYCEASLSLNDSNRACSIHSSFEHKSEMDAPMLSLGVGARPKDLSTIKKNRPSSLLGLSKVSLDMPAVVKPKVTAGVEDASILKQNLNTDDQFSNIDVRSEQTTCNRLSDVLVLDSQTVSEVRLRADSACIADSGSKDEVHDSSQSFSDIDASQRNDESLITADGLDSESLESLQISKQANSLHLQDDRDGHEYDKDIEYEAQSETTDGIEDYAGGTKPDVDFSGSLHDPVQQGSLGHVAPFWIPDTVAQSCMICQTKFTIWKRRHHCRACGKVLCAGCCNQKAFLSYMENREARVCVECHIHLSLVPGMGTNLYYPTSDSANEYSSIVPLNQQASSIANPPVLVPAGVLKSSGSVKHVSEPKQVMFSDGIRPGGDLTELDFPEQSLPARTVKAQQTSQQSHKLKESSLTRSRSLIPKDGLPPLLASKTETGYVKPDETFSWNNYVTDYKSEEGPLITYAVGTNLSVGVKIINLDCCMNKVCWCFVTHGMDTAGQSELVVILELADVELASPSLSPPREMFIHFQTIYVEALKGNIIQEMDYFVFHDTYMRNEEGFGFLFLQPTFQCLIKIPLPECPYLFGILIQKWELPWARLFPIRLMLRLGAEHRYYPCPLISMKNRKPVFFETGHTIINLLADFHSYQYMLPQIKGVTIKIENKKTVISFPRNRYNDIMKALRSSNEHVMALGSSFSLEVDSHLVCIQSEDGSYQTLAINIQNKPRLITGASFVVFNGALKTSSGLRAKSSIVEDGIMVQILPEMLASIKEAMKSMTDYVIECGPVDTATSDEVVELRWVDNYRNFNIGVKSYLDGTSLECVEVISVKCPSDYLSGNLAIRWTRVYLLENQGFNSSDSDSMHITQLMKEIAHACCIALVKNLEELKKDDQVKLGLRVNLTRESIGYEIGSNGHSLPVAMLNNLDTYLVPIVHQTSEKGIILEFVFNIID